MPKAHYIPYINREISWLSFNERVLQEAADPTTPLIERLKFLGIFSNNRDEFYRVRVATVKRLSKLGKKAKLIYGEDPLALLKNLQQRVIQQQNQFESIYKRLLRELAKSGVYIINENKLSAAHKHYISGYFENELQTLLFPILIESPSAFPYLKDKASYLFLKLKTLAASKNTSYALIEIPESSRFVQLPSMDKKQYIILVDDVIRHCANRIFNVFGLQVTHAFNIKLTRDAELDVDNDVSKSMIEKISNSLKARKKGQPVRFVYDSAMPADMLKFIFKCLGMTNTDNAIPGGRYHNFKNFINFPDLGIPELYYPKIQALHHPAFTSALDSMIDIITKRDVLLHYPYHHFNHIITLLREASIDPRVESIKITLYRIANQSKIANALINAVKNGKKVTVLIELQARFDEENNLYWARKLQEEGARVIHGVPGLKVHSKLILIKTRSKAVASRIAHFGTGNFNEKTSRIYTDFALLTANTALCEDLEHLFHFYENNFEIQKFKKLVVAPFYMRSVFSGLLEDEMRFAKHGKPAEIILKMNSLVDRDMIRLLYKAHQAGVKITLIIRGACSLVTELKGWSEHIQAVSIVDKYLEHTRVFYFYHNGKEKLYISSADWMSRNLDHRSEVAVPISDETIKTQILDILKIQLSGNTKVRILNRLQSNVYKTRMPKEKPVRAQDAVYHYLKLNLHT
jgi:polyphosphate kinase